MSANNGYNKRIWRTKVFWELSIINVAVIAVVIGIAAFSVKEFACSLADEMNITSGGKQSAFNQTMDYYLIRVSIIAFFVAVLIHYFWIKRVIKPIQALSSVTKRMSKGEIVGPVPVTSNNEVGLLTENFNELLMKIERSEQLRNQMAADLAHEVRTPLSNITGYLEALKNGVVEPDHRLLNSLHGEAERLKKMIEKLYQLSERQWDDYVTEKTTEHLNVKDLVEKMVSIHSVALQMQRIKVNISVQQSNLLISEDIMKQIVGNLLDNAINYAVEGTEIDISGEVEDRFYKLQVAGRGQPIPVEAKAHLFERFYRVDDSRSRLSGGNGLGLAIVKELVEFHKGNVTLETDGTYHRFIITLPT